VDNSVCEGAVSCEEKESCCLFIKSADRKKGFFREEVIDKAIAGMAFVAAEKPFGLI